MRKENDARLKARAFTKELMSTTMTILRAEFSNLSVKEQQSLIQLGSLYSSELEDAITLSLIEKDSFVEVRIKMVLILKKYVEAAKNTTNPTEALANVWITTGD